MKVIIIISGPITAIFELFKNGLRVFGYMDLIQDFYNWSVNNSYSWSGSSVVDMTYAYLYGNEDLYDSMLECIL